jgi:hypothetical protein
MAQWIKWLQWWQSEIRVIIIIIIHVAKKPQSKKATGGEGGCVEIPYQRSFYHLLRGRPGQL